MYFAIVVNVFTFMFKCLIIEKTSYLFAWNRGKYIKHLTSTIEAFISQWKNHYIFKTVSNMHCCSELDHLVFQQNKKIWKISSSVKYTSQFRIEKGNVFWHTLLQIKYLQIAFCWKWFMSKLVSQIYFSHVFLDYFQKIALTTYYCHK